MFSLASFVATLVGAYPTFVWMGKVQATAALDGLAFGKLIPGTSYKALCQIGAGGMSSVYEVEHIYLGRKFVLKALRGEFSQRADLVRRLENEWRALAKLRHPNVVEITDAGTTDAGVPYYVMERLRGVTLQQRLQHGGAMSVPQSVEVALGVLGALKAAHSLGMVHRDVKPANIFLPRGGRPKLLDFGIVKDQGSVSTSVTASGVTIGTPRYMSPEHASGERLDARSDLYAVGLILFEMVAGRHPFFHVKGGSSLLAAQLQRVPPLLSQVLPGVSPALSQLVASLLDKHPDKRPADAAAVSACLLQLLVRYAPAVSTTQITTPALYLTRPVASEAAPTPAAAVAPEASTGATRQHRRRMAGRIKLLAAGGVAVLLGAAVVGLARASASSTPSQHGRVAKQQVEQGSTQQRAAPLPVSSVPLAAPTTPPNPVTPLLSSKPRPAKTAAFSSRVPAEREKNELRRAPAQRDPPAELPQASDGAADARLATADATTGSDAGLQLRMPYSGL